MTLKLILVRHGESFANAANKLLPLEERVVGESNNDELTNNGREEAIELGKKLRDYLKGFPDLVVCSQAVRTKETCQESLPNYNYIVAPELNELYKGIWEGRRVCDVITPEIQKQLDSLNWDFKHPNGESREEVYRRGLSFIEKEVIPKYYINAVFFTHLDFIRCLMTGLLNKDKSRAYQIKVPNASAIVLKYENEKWQEVTKL